MSYNVIIVVCICMHAFTNFNVIILLHSTFSQMIEFMCKKVYIMIVVNMHVVVYKILVRCGKINGKHYVS
jgi:hypothetical protein